MAAIDAFATLLKIGDGAATETFATVAGVHDISGPGMSKTVHDTTVHSAGVNWRLKKGGLKDGGQITFAIHWDPDNSTHDDATGLQSLFEGDDNNNFQVVFPATTDKTWDFDGVVSGFSPTAPVDGLLTADVTIDVSGQPTIS